MTAKGFTDGSRVVDHQEISPLGRIVDSLNGASLCPGSAGVRSAFAPASRDRKHRVAKTAKRCFKSHEPWRKET